MNLICTSGIKYYALVRSKEMFDSVSAGCNDAILHPTKNRLICIKSHIMICRDSLSSRITDECKVLTGGHEANS